MQQKPTDPYFPPQKIGRALQQGAFCCSPGSDDPVDAACCAGLDPVDDVGDQKCNRLHSRPEPDRRQKPEALAGKHGRCRFPPVGGGDAEHARNHLPPVGSVGRQPVPVDGGARNLLLRFEPFKKRSHGVDCALGGLGDLRCRRACDAQQQARRRRWSPARVDQHPSGSAEA